MKKNGLVNIRQDSKEKFERFISDFFTTMGLDLTSNDLSRDKRGQKVKSIQLIWTWDFSSSFSYSFMHSVGLFSHLFTGSMLRSEVVSIK